MDRAKEDLISRQAAIDAMTNTLWHYPNECYRNLNEYEFAKGLAELGLKSVPSAQPEPQWISCSERLPKKPGQYYVSGGDKVWICEFLIIQNFIGGWCNDAANPMVQAWMPLPEPYREEGGE